MLPNVLMTPPPSNEIAFQVQMIEENDESPPMSSSPELEMTSDQLELCLSDSDLSLEVEVNTSTEVLVEDIPDRNVEFHHDGEDDDYHIDIVG